MRWTALFVPSTLAISTLLLWALPAPAEDIVDYDGQFIAAADFIISNNRADFTLDTSRGPLTVTISNDSVPYSAFTPGGPTPISRTVELSLPFPL